MTEQSAGKAAAIKAVRRAMREHRLNNVGLAKKAGTTVDTVGDFLNGKTWPSQTTTQAAFEDALEMPPGSIQAIADGGDVESLRLIPSLHADEPVSVDDATELQLAIALLERIRKRVES